MQCRYCQNWNEEDERRCVRCGRRLHLASPRSSPESYPTSSAATALALESIPGGQPLAAGASRNEQIINHRYFVTRHTGMALRVRK